MMSEKCLLNCFGSEWYMNSGKKCGISELHRKWEHIEGKLGLWASFITVICVIGTVVNFASTLRSDVNHLTEQIRTQNEYITELESTLQREIDKVAEDVDDFSGDMSSLREEIAAISVKVFDYRPTGFFPAQSLVPMMV